jgi:ribosomal protein S6
LDNLYEAMVIVDPAQSDAELAATVEQIKSVIARADGEVETAYPLWRRRLAYQIGPYTEGHYVLVYFRGAKAVDELKRELQMSSAIVRTLVVCANKQALWLEGPPKPPAPREAERAGKEAAAEEPAAEAEAAPEVPKEAESAEPTAAEPQVEAAPEEPAAEMLPAAEAPLAAETPPAAETPSEDSATDETPTEDAEQS